MQSPTTTVQTFRITGIPHVHFTRIDLPIASSSSSSASYRPPIHTSSKVPSAALVKVVSKHRSHHHHHCHQHNHNHYHHHHHLRLSVPPNAWMMVETRGDGE
eukprot:PhM_4_TR6502/c0_g1_i1/m.58539